MSKRLNTYFICQNCGSVSPKWLGKCPDCNEWNTYVEETAERKKTGSHPAGSGSQPLSIRDISLTESRRYETGIEELDRVLGGGIVPGSSILVGGDPGIGKSTLALQVLNNVAKAGHSVLYVSGEESPRQLKLRAERLNLDSEKLMLIPETSLESILDTIGSMDAGVVIIDSIQTVTTNELASSPGSVGQIRECGARLVNFGKIKDTSFIIIGHVTKEGSIAGPKVLEHLVDTVIYFEGGKGHTYRILRAIKNRFGSTNEIGVFEMHDRGLEEVSNPSEIFLSERPVNTSGSVVIPSIEGTRPILVEIQALVSKCSFGVPRRTTIGVDSNRVSLLTAVLEKIAGIQMTGQDIYMNVAGGVTIEEPAIDLAICIALVSSFRNVSVSPEMVIFGEVGLSGEVRGVSHVGQRLQEAVRLGFKKCLIPATNAQNIKSSSSRRISISGVNSIQQAIESVFR